MTKTSRRFLFVLLILFATVLTPQTHFTLPRNVLRISVTGASSGGKWISSGGKVGLPDEFFTLEGYGTRYFDHLNPSSKKDLVGLNEIYISAIDQVGEVIYAFNNSSAASAWGDTLFDLSHDFFGPDSISIGGFVTNPSKRLNETVAEIKVEYGLTNKVTFFLDMPFFPNVTETNEWGWKSSLSDNVDLQGFVTYHTSNKAKFEELFASQAYSTLSSSLAQKLQTVYDYFYTPGGKYSLLWALKGGSDPFANAIYGADFNPFSEEDTVATTIDSLMAFYHPNRSTSGFGDICWGLDVLLYGSPAWEGESVFSLYGRIGMTLPTARIIGKFDETKVDSSGRPKQFKELPLGDGVTQWQFSLFGEFYREIFDRLIRFGWRADYGFSIEGKFWPRLSPRGTFTVQHDSILQRLGEVYRLKRGDVYAVQVTGFLELIPDRLSLSAGQSWFLKRRDRYYSDDPQWNEWMAGGTNLHEGYDTRAFQVTQHFGLIFHNIHPLKKIGPMPFELELSADLPVLTRHTWQYISASLSYVGYFQFW